MGSILWGRSNLHQQLNSSEYRERVWLGKLSAPREGGQKGEATEAKLTKYRNTSFFGGFGARG